MYFNKPLTESDVKQIIHNYLLEHLSIEINNKWPSTEFTIVLKLKDDYVSSYGFDIYDAVLANSK